MKQTFLSTILLCLLTTCNKQKSFDFPTGKWQMKSRIVKKDENYQNINYNFINSFAYSDVSIEFDGKNKITYHSNEGKEDFKLKEVDLKSDSQNYKTYTLTLKNKKGKTFVFEYDLLNNDTLIGDFWIKGKAYSSFLTPNVCEISNYSIQSGKFTVGENTIEEELGIFIK